MNSSLAFIKLFDGTGRKLHQRRGGEGTGGLCRRRREEEGRMEGRVQGLDDEQRMKGEGKTSSG